MTDIPTRPPKRFVSRARQVYLLLTVLFAAGIVVQVFFAGLGVLVEPSYFGWHTTFAHLLEALLLAMLVVGVVARVGWGNTGLNLLLFGLFTMQYVFIYGFQGAPKALHVVNALALFWLSVHLAQRSWKLAREAQSAPKADDRSVRRGGLRVGRQLAGVVAILIGAVVLFGVIFDNGPGFIRTSASRSQGELREVSADHASDTPSAEGAELFSQHCAGCHGRDGKGGFGSALAGNGRLADDAAVVTQILDGGGGMPAFNRLSDEEVAALGTHIRSSWGNDFGPVLTEDVAGQR